MGILIMNFKNTIFNFLLIITMTQAITPAQEPNQFSVPYVPLEYAPDQILVQGIIPNNKLLKLIEDIYTSIEKEKYEHFPMKIEYIRRFYTQDFDIKPE